TAEPRPPALFDVVADPGESVDRIETEPALVADLERRYASMKAPAEPVAPALPAGGKEKRAALGYLGSAQAYDHRTEPDTRRFVGVVALVDAAQDQALAGRVPESIEALQILTSSPISRALALRSLASLLLAVGRNEEAIDAVRQLGAITGGAE